MSKAKLIVTGEGFNRLIASGELAFVKVDGDIKPSLFYKKDPVDILFTEPKKTPDIVLVRSEVISS